MNLLDLSPASQPTPDPETYEAIVSEDAVAGQPVYVVIPDFDPQLNHGPCPWIPIVASTGIFYPHKGDAAVVVQPAAGDPWIASWTPLATAPDVSTTFKENCGASAVWNIDHNLGTLDVQVEIVRVSDGATVLVDVVRLTTNRVVVTFGSAPTAGQYRALVRTV